ncbi:MAG: hypothetical protein OEV78_09630 [Spirochaetia bacterium]|nr:hypothetical protein [Spirochaetia bacterium]
MKFLSDKQNGDSHKISFSDVDDWGYASKGIIITTNNDYLIKGLELYTARHGVVRCDQKGNITYCQGWEKDHVKLGIGVSSHFAAKLIGNAQESLELFDKIYNQIMEALDISFLQNAIKGILKDKREVKLDPALFILSHDENIRQITKAKQDKSIKKTLRNRLWTK